MKLLLCLHDFLPEHVGGTEVHTAAVARALVERGHDVTCLFTERRDDVPEGHVTRSVLDGVTTLEVCHRREYGSLAETWLEPRSRAIFEGLLDDLRPDLCHFHHTATWGAGCFASAARAGARVFFTAHDYHLLCDSGRLLRADGTPCRGPLVGVASDDDACGECLARHPGVEPFASTRGPDQASAAELRLLYTREMLASVERVFAPSRFAADLLVDAGLAGEVEVLPNGLAAPVVDAALREPRPSDPKRPLRVGFVGGLFHDKGAHVLVEAARRAAAQRPLELHVHGVLEWFPDYVAGLRAAAGPSVVFHGRFAPGDADRVLGGLDLLVSPSLWYENAPLVIDEAFARRVPVVASDLGGLAEHVIDGRSGRLVPPGDVEALAAVLGELADDRAALLELARGTPPVTTLAAHVDRLERLYE